jgi:hypothetical protein
VIPRNEATAVNERCTRCQTAAEARQFVRVVPQRVRFTGRGRRELAAIRSDLRALAYADLPLADLHQAVEDDEARVNDVLANDLVHGRGPERGCRRPGRAAAPGHRRRLRRRWRSPHQRLPPSRREQSPSRAPMASS